MNGAREIYFNTQLKSVPLFSNLSNRQLDILYKAGVIKKFTRGDVIVYQDDPGDTFYIVVSGRVKVTLLNEDGKEIVLSILKGGDFFGELSLLDDEPRSANVIIVEDTSLFSLTRTQFYQLISARPDILRKVLKEICTRLRDADEKIGSLAFLDVYGRTIRILQQMAHDQGIKTRNGIEILNAPTHQELSNMVGASREAITRIIKILKENRNLVSYKGRRLILREYSVKSLL
jgi:CRP/FNR family transcriptional regulator, cyclic AMP receptor protein